jgi:hypothetical protein
MLRTLSSLHGFTMGATDGDIGRVVDCYFDDQSWTVRHLVVDTGGWLEGRQVLLSPMSLRGVDWDNSRIAVNLTKAQIENSPSIDTDKPISRQREMEFYGYYGMPYYWTGPYRWGLSGAPFAQGGAAGIAPVPPASGTAGARGGVPAEEPEGDPHLRSSGTVTGYYIRAGDGEIGHVEDFVVDDEDWAIRYLIVDTRNWLPGKHVLVSPDWIERISWAESTVSVHMTREAVENSPEYDPSRPVDRPYENRLYDYYGRPRYWGRDRAA